MTEVQAKHNYPSVWHEVLFYDKSIGCWHVGKWTGISWQLSWDGDRIEDGDVSHWCELPVVIGKQQGAEQIKEWGV